MIAANNGSVALARFAAEAGDHRTAQSRPGAVVIHFVLMRRFRKFIWSTRLLRFSTIVGAFTPGAIGLLRPCTLKDAFQTVLNSLP